jgi:ferric-dicitrate binding protein FerR (iron transport regulator)
VNTLYTHQPYQKMKRESMPPFNDLLQKFIREELSPAELQTFLALAREPANQDVIREAIGQFLDADTFIDLSAGVDADQQFVGALKKAKSKTPVSLPQPIHRIRPLYRQWWAAASVILLLAAGTAAYFQTRHSRRDQPVAVRPQINIAPGKQGAILTLANGTPLVLDSLGNGVVATQNGAKVVLKNGQLAYQSTAGDKRQATSETVLNTLSTPKGRQFQLMLPDGTKVWLNAASSIRFPTMFAGKERQVQVTGEAYFEVAGDAKMPFRVKAGNQAEIEVLGTHFNVNAYENEPDLKTTLLEGKVKVVSNKSALPGTILQPGQQAIIRPDDPSGQATLVQAADIDKVMAWKNGVFNFEGASLREVMNQIERWYDITVVYEKGVPDIKFFGEMSRNFNLADLIDALKDVGVHFKIETGRRLVVLP